MEEVRVAPTLVDSVSQELLKLFEEGITTVRKVPQLSSDHGAWFKEVVDRIRKCASLGQAIGKAASSLLEESYDSDQRPHQRSLTLGDTTGYQTVLLSTGVKGEVASSTLWTPGLQHERRLQAILSQGLLLVDSFKGSFQTHEPEMVLLSQVRGHLTVLQESPKDARDEHAAKASELMDELLEGLQKHVRRIFRDIVILACTRIVNPENNARLRDQLRAAFGRYLEKDFLSRLCNSSHKLFERPKQQRNRSRKQVAHPTDSHDNREIEKLEPYHQLAFPQAPGLSWAERPPPISPPEGFRINNTFIEQIKPRSECTERMCAASEMDLRKKWGYEWRPPKIDDLQGGEREEALLVMGLLSEYFDSDQMKSIEGIWAELFACRDIPWLQDQRFQKVNIGDVVEATEKVIQSLGQNRKTVAHCCAALSQLAVSKVQVAHRVVSIIVNVIGVGVQCVRPILIWRIFQVHKVALGVATSESTIDTHPGLLRTMKTFLFAQKDDSLRADCVRVLARCQPLPDLLGALGDDEDLWEKALDEIYNGLDQQIAFSFWSSPDHKSAWALEERDSAREVLLEVSRQLGSGPVACPSEATLARWAYVRDRTDQRFKLIGILFGVQRTLLDPLFAALDFGQQHGVLDEDYIMTIFRALIELEFLGLVPIDAADRIVQRISDRSVRLRTNSCMSAFVSVLASLVRQSADCGKVEIILEVGCYYAKRNSSSDVLYETLWALSILFENLDTAHALRAIAFVEEVREKHSASGVPESEPASWSNDTRGYEYKAWRLATILLATWSGLGSGAEGVGEVSASTVDSDSAITKKFPRLDEADSSESS